MTISLLFWRFSPAISDEIGDGLYIGFAADCAWKNWGNNGLGYLDFRKHPHAGKNEKHSDGQWLSESMP